MASSGVAIVNKRRIGGKLRGFGTTLENGSRAWSWISGRSQMWERLVKRKHHLQQKRRLRPLAERDVCGGRAVGFSRRLPRELLTTFNQYKTRADGHGV